MTKNFVKILPALMTLLLSASLLQAQKPALLKGIPQESTIMNKNKVSVEMMGQTIDNETQTDTRSLVTLDKITDSGFVFSSRIQHMVIAGSSMGQEVHFDSDKKEDMESPMGQALKTQINSIQDISLDPTCRILKMELRDNGGDAGTAGAMDAIGSMTKGQPFPLLVPLSGHGYKKGSSWTDSAGSLETLKTVTRYEVKDLSSGIILISFTGSVAKKGTVKVKEIEMQIDLEGTLSGEASYEQASGLLIKNTTESKAKGSYEIMGQTAPFNSTNTLITTVKKADPVKG